jgi:hypothetical protein
MKNNIPANAMTIMFKALGGKYTRYSVWSKDGHFYWATLGNTGREDNLEAAMRAAREYILMGVNGLKSHGEYRGVFSSDSQ